MARTYLNAKNRFNNNNDNVFYNASGKLNMFHVNNLLTARKKLKQPASKRSNVVKGKTSVKNLAKMFGS